MPLLVLILILDPSFSKTRGVKVWATSPIKCIMGGKFHDLAANCNRVLKLSEFKLGGESD